MSQNLVAKKTRAGGVDLDKSFIVTIDEKFDPDENRVKRSAGAFCLNNAVLFPPVVGIDSVDVRKSWKPGQKIIMNWPENGGGLNLVETTVYDLFSTKKGADKICEQLTTQFEQESRDASAMAFQEDVQDQRGMFSDHEDGNGDESAPALFSPIRDSPALRRPAKKKKRIEAPSTATMSIAQLACMIQSMEKRFDSKFDVLTRKVDDLKAENVSLKLMLKEVKGGVKTTARRSKEACNLLEGKDAVYREPIGAVDCSFLFDPESERLFYMTIDITEEINNFFIENGCDQKDFAKGLGKKFYGGDLWFWMITTSEGSKPGQRKSLAKRDPAGVVLIDKILRCYFDKVFWPRHPAYLEKLAALTDKTPAEIEMELAPKKQNAFRVFHLNAVAAINDWGNDCRKREKKYDWKDSLFGQFIQRVDTDKPPGYDAEKEEQWRKKCYAEKSVVKKASAAQSVV